VPDWWQHGQLKLAENALQLHAPAIFPASDSFTYKVNDGTSDGKRCRSASPSIAVTICRSRGRRYETAEDTTLFVIDYGSALPRRHGRGQRYPEAFLWTCAARQLSLAQNGSSPTPAGNFHGNDSFTYK